MRLQELTATQATTPRTGIPSRLIALALVAIIVFPGVLFAGFLLYRFADAEKARYEQDAREVAQAASSLLDRQLLGWQAALQTLATSDNIRTENWVTFYAQAARVKAVAGGDIGLRSIGGEPILNTAVPYGTPLPPSRITSNQQAIAAGRPFISDVFVGAVVDRPLIAVVVPITIEGNAKYLLHVSVATTALRDIMLSLVPADWIVAVADRAGVYIARSQDDDAYRGKPGVASYIASAVGQRGNFEGKSAKGEDVLVGYVRSDVSQWLLAANIRRATIEQPLQAALLQLAGFGALALILSSLIAIWLWRLIERPLAVLTLAGGQLGRVDGAITLPTRLREFATLRDVLSAASQEIRSASIELENRVAGRTRELEAVNQNLTAEIARRTRSEAMLVQAQKMEAIGNLTGGVAHDFNNLLQVISGNLQLLAREITGNEKAQIRIERAMAGVARGSHLASQLLAFGRRQPLEPKVVNVGKLLRGMDDLLRRTIGEAVEIETVVAGGLWNTLVDPANLENALLNLAINSRDAMDGHGKLTIEAGNAFLDDAYSDQHAEVEAGQYVQVSVTDTGAGMTPEVLAQAFEPFFSTKAPGKGTGLGLSMVFGFVKQTGGHVKVYSEPGQGTTVKLYLPRSNATEDTQSEPEAGPIVGGSETIFVVEDDEAVRDTVVALLTELGYRVLKASDAQSALVVVESGVTFDMLFTDVVMPGALKSYELARRAKEILPQLSVLFTSGYTENSIVHGGRLDEGVNLLSKPYSRETLARKIRWVFARDGKLPGSDERQPSMFSEPTRVEAVAPPLTDLTVLLCEDDALIRMDTAELVRELGYTVIETDSGQAALDIAANQSIDILMIDVGLPDIPGGEVATRIRELWPEVAVVFATGQTKASMSEFKGRSIVLTKPYQITDLKAALIEAIRSKPA